MSRRGMTSGGYSEQPAEEAEDEDYMTALTETEPDDECEREDCQRIAATASDVYCEITGGLLSKPTYDARTILAYANDSTQQLIDEAVAEAREGTVCVRLDGLADKIAERLHDQQCDAPDECSHAPGEIDAHDARAVVNLLQSLAVQ